MKACTVGIGIIPINGFKPLAVLGSGFFVNSQGFVMTAAHVFESCKYVYEEFARNHVKTFVGAIQVNLETNAFDINVLPLNIIKTSKTEVKSVLGIENIDIGIGIPKDYSKTVPFLEIKNPSSSNLYHEIIMSGYPGGDKSLNINENDGMRLSPITQFGRITGFMPTDNTPIPWGLQTDIIGTGGSSGSPLVDLSDGKVVGIAQKVLSSTVEGKFKGFTKDSIPKNITGIFNATTKIGLVYGITSFYFKGLHEKVKEDYEKGVEKTQYTIMGTGASLIKLKTGRLDIVKT